MSKTYILALACVNEFDFFNSHRGRPDFHLKFFIIPEPAKWTEEEMEAMRIPPWKRDYCAHLIAPLKKCLNQNHPVFGRCLPEKEDYQHCQQNE